MRESKFSVAIAMPAHNEGEGIEEFITEIAEAFNGVQVSFVIVNDVSSDDTVSILNSLNLKLEPEIRVVSNQTNLGHGPSTIRALKSAANLKTNYVIAVDGDGQFLGSDIRRLFDTVSALEGQVGEGIRTQRTDPMFRKITTQLTRILVGIRCKKYPIDANTPLRVYPRTYLLELLNTLPSDLLTPNLHISAHARLSPLAVVEVKVTSLPRRGISASGTMWKARTNLLPSKRFTKFCFSAASQWFTVSVTRPGSD